MNNVLSRAVRHLTRWIGLVVFLTACTSSKLTLHPVSTSVQSETFPIMGTENIPLSTTIVDKTDPAPTVISTSLPARSPTLTFTPISTITPSPQLSPTNIPPVVHAGWISYTNANYIRAILIDRDGDLWTGGSGGVVHWNTKTGDYVKYTTEYGLASNFVTSIAQSSDGSLWFGTYGSGISRFDGHAWRTYTKQDGLIDNTVWCVLVARDDKLWIGTGNGVSSYDGKTWSSYNLETTGDPVGTVEALTETPDGTLWFGNHRSGLRSLVGGQWHIIDNMPENSVTSLAVAPDGSLWVGAIESVMHWNGQKWDSFPVTNQVSSIAVTHNGSVWIGYSLMETLGMPLEWLSSSPSNQEVSRYDGNEWITINASQGLNVGEIRAIQIGLDGAIWFGSYNQGVMRYDGHTWHAFKTADSQCSNFIRDFEISKDGIVWAVYPGGVSPFDGENWHCIDQLGNLENNYKPTDIYVVHVDSEDEEVWFGTSDGIAVYDGNNWSIYSKNEFPWIGVISAIKSLPDGSHIIASDDSIYKFDGKEWSLMKQLGKTIQVIQVLQDGSIWLGTTDGVYYTDWKMWKHYTTVNGLVGDIVEAIAVDPDNTVWVGTCIGGLSRFDGNAWKKFFMDDNLAGSCVLDIATAQDGSIWIGTTEGLSKFDGQSWKIYRTQDGLSDNYIQGISIAPDGTIWFATGAGFSSYIPSEP